MNEITQQTLETIVPSFRNATDEIFNKVHDRLDFIQTKLYSDLELEGISISPNIEKIIVRHVCYAAAFHTIAQLDLVLTPTGFGIVSNQHVAPASRERTAALSSRLYQDASDSFDLLIDLLRGTDWSGTQSASSLISRFVYSPTVARRSGMSQEMYGNEFAQSAHKLSLGEAYLSASISVELYNHIVSQLRSGSRLTSHEQHIFHLGCKLVASIASDRSGSHILRDSLREYLERYADEIIQYKTSTLYSSLHGQRYENKQEDTAYFFG